MNRTVAATRGAIMITLNQLRVFWAVAHSDSLTRAAKQLGVTQPALSQQLAKLENALGGQLFDRVNNQLVLSDAGRFLLRKAETVLAEIDEAEAGPRRLQHGPQAAGSRWAPWPRSRAPSCRTPTAWPWSSFPTSSSTCTSWPPPRRWSSSTAATCRWRCSRRSRWPRTGISFSRIDLASDPYVFAVPRGLDLGCVTDPERDLTAEQRRVLNRTIQFNFGNLHNQRVDEWYRRVLPRHQVAAWCRTYESALAMVQAGLGVALVPQLCTQLGGKAAYDVDLHAVPEMDRPIVALIPPQYRRAQPFAAFLECLKRAAAGSGSAARRPTAAVPRRRTAAARLPAEA